MNDNGTMTITGSTISNNSASGIAFALAFFLLPKAAGY